MRSAPTPETPEAASAADRLDRAVGEADWAAARSAVRDGWFDLVTPAHADASRTVFARIPTAVLRAEPLLAMEYGILLNQTRYQRLRALRFFVMAVRAARSDRNDLDPADRLLIRASESAAFRLLGRTGLSVSAARAAMALAETLSDADRAAVPELPRIFAVVGVSFFAGDLPNEALHAAETGIAEATTQTPSDGMGALALLCGIPALRGDLPQAAEHLDYARSGPWTDAQRDGYSGVLYRVAEAYSAMERLDSDEALSQLHRLAAMTTGRHANEHWILLAETLAMAELVAGRPGHGLAAVDEFVELRDAEGSHRARVRLARVRALLQLAMGNPDGATAVLRRDRPETRVARLEHARIALALGQTRTALTELRALGAERLSTRQAAEAAVIDAAVLLRLSPTPRRAGAVQRLGSLLERSGQRLALALLPPADLRRVSAALVEAGFMTVGTDPVLRPLLPDVEPSGLLSERELAVLGQLARTGSLAEIAASLVVSTNTVKSQTRSVYRKLGVSNREDAIAVASERHLLVIEE